MSDEIAAKMIYVARTSQRYAHLSRARLRSDPRSCSKTSGLARSRRFSRARCNIVRMALVREMCATAERRWTSTSRWPFAVGNWDGYIALETRDDGQALAAVCIFFMFRLFFIYAVFLDHPVVLNAVHSMPTMLVIRKKNQCNQLTCRKYSVVRLERARRWKRWWWRW